MLGPLLLNDFAKKNKRNEKKFAGVEAKSFFMRSQKTFGNRLHQSQNEMKQLFEVRVAVVLTSKHC